MSQTPSVRDSAENLADRPAPSWLKRVPMVTGVLAGLAGFLTVKSGTLSHQANYYSTQAVLHQARASDDWEEYQADSVKRHIDRIAVLTNGLDPSHKSDLEKEINDLQGNRQAKEQADARNEETLCSQNLTESDKRLSIKDMLDNYAGVAAQLGIALTSIAALTRKKSVFTAGIAAGVLAIAITGYALIEPFLVHLLHH